MLRCAPDHGEAPLTAARSERSARMQLMVVDFGPHFELGEQGHDTDHIAPPAERIAAADVKPLRRRTGSLLIGFPPQQEIGFSRDRLPGMARPNGPQARTAGVLAWER